MVKEINMSKIICLRDDDTNYYTSYSELSDGYGKYWSVLPVTLATVPFVHGSESKIMEFEYPADKKFERLYEWQKNADIQELSEYHMTMPIGKNIELVGCLKKLISDGKVEIAQHGINHRYNVNGPEMYYDNIGLNMIKDGKEYLEKLFGTEVKVFVPPSNCIDGKCAAYIRRLNMDLFCCAGITERKRYEKFFYYLKYPYDIISFAKEKLLKLDLPIRSRQGINIVNSKTFGINVDVGVFYEKIKIQLENYGASSITMHYRLLKSEEFRIKYWELLDMLCAIEDIEFLTVSDYIGRLKS